MATSFQKNVKGFILPDVTAHQAEVAIAFFNLQLHLGHPLFQGKLFSDSIKEFLQCGN